MKEAEYILRETVSGRCKTTADGKLILSMDLILLAMGKYLDERQLKAVPYQCCPVCNGSGKAMDHSKQIPMYTDTCTVCEGKKIIPMQILTPTNP